MCKCDQRKVKFYALFVKLVKTLSFFCYFISLIAEQMLTSWIFIRVVH